jgi:carnitine O-acetyltransferase
MLREGETTPAIYTDEAFGKTNHWELSTSQLSSPFVDGWGYGEGVSAVSCCEVWIADAPPVVPDGYGLSYSIGDHWIRWTITSMRRNTADLKHYIAEAATETRVMMENAAKAAGAGKEGKAKL